MESVSRSVTNSVSKMYNSLPQTFGFQKNVNVVKQEATMGVVAFRLHPGDDLRQSLLTIITKYYAMDAAVVLTCVGNLRKCRVKFASSQISSGSVPPSPMAKSGANNSPFARDTQVENAGASMSGEHADAAGNSDRDSPTSVESGDNVWNQRMGSFHGGPMPLHSPSTSLTRAHGTVDLFQREDEVLEIVSLVGTLSGGESGDCNLNIALADRNGNVIGGKLMDGCEIYRTAEIVLGKISGMKFTRRYDKETGYFELMPDVLSPN